ncbi:MAG: peroxiredoxin [Gammaproteobacteria bacterium]|nr:MAG: peroxiredoxin [Gammaproteobacteria bacterium]TDJ42719.1 MAG: peroxiredoxin [Gammaproteobacteria bacterium]
MLKVGDTAPDFALEEFDGPETTLSELLDGKSLVVYFYPADFSPVCTREACALRDRHDALREVGVRVLGVSPQGRESHRRFRESYQLPFALLSDPSRKVIDAFGVNGPLGFGVRRATFLIGPDRVIRTRAVAEIFLGSHMDLIQAAIDGSS